MSRKINKENNMKEILELTKAMSEQEVRIRLGIYLQAEEEGESLDPYDVACRYEELTEETKENT